ncbi:hypothetical protein K493DRAFT_238979 [Basidiobolus meristosporus CBS 931.73]|uniref:Conidiation protein 6 n=1 Tax=Basidiobolus meristosporus CBS 931.73 TaxID=1314790 RepID=A0A1Y1XGU9_9FUNG|nr:hypothetical protein K493DRAFT_238979 [Basidiobolus meristosporus CBS 931.73]|eukprot:ORX84922.1 hypothetical protein K493DRAFT_238979 [Basidiobolus meristosporus CBS 931.73]
MEYEGKNPGNVEGGFKAAAHNPNVSAEKQQESLEKASQIHEERQLTFSTMEYEGKNPGNVEGGFKAAARNPNVSAEKQQESLEKASKIHEERTGEPLKDQTIQKESKDSK